MYNNRIACFSGFYVPVCSEPSYREYIYSTHTRVFFKINILYHVTNSLLRQKGEGRNSCRLIRGICGSEENCRWVKCPLSLNSQTSSVIRVHIFWQKTSNKDRTLSTGSLFRIRKNRNPVSVSVWEAYLDPHQSQKPDPDPHSMSKFRSFGGSKWSSVGPWTGTLVT
jgi:hypothetical protein